MAPVWQLSWAHPDFGGLLASGGYDRFVTISERLSIFIARDFVDFVCRKCILTQMEPNVRRCRISFFANYYHLKPPKSLPVQQEI